MAVKTQEDDVRIQRISLADVRSFASVTNTVFARDPGTAFAFSYPSRKDHPEEYPAAVEKTEPLRQASMLRRYLDQTTYMVCAKIDSQIAGISIWSPPEDFKISSPLHLRMLRLIVSVYDTVSSYLYPEWLQKWINPTEYEVTRSRIKGREVIMAVDDDLKRIALANGPKEGSYWTLAVLGVSEEYGRRGIGTKLLHWGFEEADKIDRAIFVSASEEGTALYIKSGFEVLYKAPQVVYDPVRGWVSQTYLIRWQKSKRKAGI